MPLVNCEMNIILTWSKNCVITNRAHREKTIGTGTEQNLQFPGINNPTSATIKIADTKLYFPVVTLTTENDKRLLKQWRTVFKRTSK